MALLNTMMDCTAIIVRNVKSGIDDRGGTTQNFQIINSGINSAGVPCHLNTSASPGDVLYKQQQDESTGTLFFYGDSGAQVEDIAIVTDRNLVTSYQLILSGAKAIGRFPLRALSVKEIAEPNGLPGKVNTTVG